MVLFFIIIQSELISFLSDFDKTRTCHPHVQSVRVRVRVACGMYVHVAGVRAGVCACARACVRACVRANVKSEVLLAFLAINSKGPSFNIHASD